MLLPPFWPPSKGDRVPGSTLRSLYMSLFLKRLESPLGKTSVILHSLHFLERKKKAFLLREFVVSVNSLDNISFGQLVKFSLIASSKEFSSYNFKNHSRNFSSPFNLLFYCTYGQIQTENSKICFIN